MSEHAPNLLTLFDVPDLHFSRVEADADEGAVGRPLHAADVRVGRGLEKRRDGAAFCAPDVNVALETDGHLIAARPVKQIEVVIVYEAGGVEYAFGSRQDSPPELRGLHRGGGLEWTVVLCPQVDRLA